MNKELEALERLKTAPNFMGGTYEYKNCTHSETLLTEDYELVKKGLLKIEELKDEIEEEIKKQNKILEAYEEVCEEDVDNDIHEIEGEIYGYKQILRIIERIQNGKR